MVEIQRSRGIDARGGDVQDLPFEEAEFDVAVAAWMLYHVPDIDRGLAELARVLKPGGILVAVTNALDHLQELWDLAQRPSSVRHFTFRSENGEEALRRHFAQVEQRDARGWVTMDDDAVRGFAASWDALASLVNMPRLTIPIRVRRHSTVFTAHKAVG
jgi:SAM-dependent methyltransferase